MRLKHNMYAEGSKMFGIHEGQVRADDFVHNGGWYNAAGEKLGWGDLTGRDIERIASELIEGEAFYILSECDSYWDCPAANKTLPGPEYVKDKVKFIIEPGKLVVMVNGSHFPSQRHEAELAKCVTRYNAYFQTEVTIEARLNQRP